MPSPTHCDQCNTPLLSIVWSLVMPVATSAHFCCCLCLYQFISQTFGDEMQATVYTRRKVEEIRNATSDPEKTPTEHGGEG